MRSGRRLAVKAFLLPHFDQREGARDLGGSQAVEAQVAEIELTAAAGAGGTRILGGTCARLLRLAVGLGRSLDPRTLLQPLDLVAQSGRGLEL